MANDTSKQKQTPRLSDEASKIAPETRWLALLLVTHWPEARILAATVNGAGAKVNATIERSRGGITREHVAAIIVEHRLTKDGEKRTPRLSVILDKLRARAKSVFDGTHTKAITEGRLPESEELGAACVDWVRGLKPEVAVSLKARALRCLCPEFKQIAGRLDVVGDSHAPMRAGLARFVATLMADLHDGGSRLTQRRGGNRVRVADDLDRWNDTGAAFAAEGEVT
jgi:hypothetical protein